MGGNQVKDYVYKILNKSSSIDNCFGWLSYIIDELKIMDTLLESEIYPNEVPENQVTITTRHSSKGLEFEAVILLGMEEGNFPHYTHLDNPIALAED